MWDPRSLARSLVASLAITATTTARPAPAHAQACVDYAMHMRVTGWTDMHGTPSDIVLDGQYAYLTVYDYLWDTGLLLVYDVADVEHPTLVTSLLLWDSADGLALAGRHLYIACGLIGYANLKVVDVSDPTSPRLVTQVPVAGRAAGITVAGSYAYVAAGPGGLSIFALSNPEQPQLVATVSTPGSVDDVSVAGGVAAIVEGAVNLRLLDTRAPEQPSLLGEVRLPGYAIGVAASGSYAYAVCYPTSLHVIDIADATQPIVLQTVETTHMPRDITIDGGHLYVPTGQAGFDVFDIATPGTARWTGSLYTATSRRAVCIRDGYAYCADAERLWIADVRRPTSPGVVGAIATQTDASEVVVKGDVAYVADGYSGLKIYDVADASRPALLGALDIPGQVNGVDVDVDHAYLAAINSLQIVDVQRPWAPLLASVVELPVGVGDVAVSGGYAFVADGVGGLQVVDVTDPHAPGIVGSLLLPGFAGRIVVAGHLAYVVDTFYDGGLMVIELADPRHPTMLAQSEEFPGVAYDLAVSGDKAYVAVYGRGLVVVDIAEPRRPVLVAEAKTPSLATGVGVGGGYAYVIDGRGLQVVEVTNPMRPFLLGSMSPRFELNTRPPMGVALASGLVYLALGPGGLQIVPAQCAAEVAVMLADFDAQVAPDQVVVTWGTSAPTPAGAFRLMGTAAGREWNVAVEQVSAESFRAQDPLSRWPAHETTVAYRLGLLEGDGQWRLLAEQEVDRADEARTLTLSVDAVTFGDQAVVSFELREQQLAEVAVYDVRGQRITTLVRDSLPAGSHQAVWRAVDRFGRRVASGAYYVRLRAGREVVSKKVLLVR